MIPSNDAPSVFYFHLPGNEHVHDVSFEIRNDVLITTCTCNYKDKTSFCRHRLYMLAGRKDKLPEAEHAQLDAFLNLLSENEAGRKMIKEAKIGKDGETRCRRCESEQIIDTKKTFRGKMYRLISINKHRYHCKKCGWDW